MVPNTGINVHLMTNIFVATDKISSISVNVKQYLVGYHEARIHHSNRIRTIVSSLIYTKIQQFFLTFLNYTMLWLFSNEEKHMRK